MAASTTVRREQLQGLGTALVCDVLDSLDVRSSFLGADIRPIAPAPPFAGPALTLRCRPSHAVSGEPYGVLFEALATPRDGAVLVIAAGDHESGVWGELLSVAAAARGVVGVVTDGLTRDREGIVALGFPVHTSGCSPLDSAGRQDFAELDVPVTIGGVTVRGSDWIVADDLGAVAVPGHYLDRVIELATDKQQGETTVRAELMAGEDLGTVFRRHGIL